MKAGMKLVFAGTPEFAREALAALHAAGFQIPLVLTQPDRSHRLRGVRRPTLVVHGLADRMVNDFVRVADAQD